MLKIGCSNISIALTLLGIMPLLGGMIGLYQLASHFEEGFRYGWFFQTVILLAFGLSACGYRSCLYLSDNFGVIESKIFFFIIRRKKIVYSKYNDIYVDMDSPPVPTMESQTERNYYTVTLRGDVTNEIICDFMRFERMVLDRKSWGLVMDCVSKVASVSGLEVNYSERVKRRNKLD